MVAPILSADCMADPFTTEGMPQQEPDQLVWFKATLNPKP